MATTLGGVEIPGVYVQETSRRVIGGQITRAVDGTPHSSPVRIVRTWTLETRLMPYDSLVALDRVYENAFGGRVAFHSDEWDAGLVYVYILEFTDDRSLVPDAKPGKNLHWLRMVLEEA